jgi:GH35 family endo-1,4-beta-xylanase
MRRDGSPLSRAGVAVEQLSHEFLFGCNLFAFGAFAAPEDEARYEYQFLRLFNLAVVPTYWPLTEPQEGQSDYARDTHGLPGPQPMIDWCAAHGLKVMAGPMMSNDVQPAWLRGKTAEDTSRIIEAHVRDLAGRFKGRVDYWDMAPNAWPTLSFPKLRLPASQAFRWAAQADGGATLLASHYAAYTLTTAAEANQKDDFGLGGLMLTAYQADGPWPPEEFEVQLQRLQRCGLPVFVTQVMIPGAAKDEQQQGRQVEEFYRAAFASPAVRGIIWWDLSDRFAWRGAPGGLLRKDLTAKPAYLALARLVHDEWWTQADGLCELDGTFTFRGFLGRYRVRGGPQNGPTGVWEIDLSSHGPRDIELTYPPAVD